VFASNLGSDWHDTQESKRLLRQGFPKSSKAGVARWLHPDPGFHTPRALTKSSKHTSPLACHRHPTAESYFLFILTYLYSTTASRPGGILPGATANTPIFRTESPSMIPASSHDTQFGSYTTNGSVRRSLSRRPPCHGFARDPHPATEDWVG